MSTGFVCPLFSFIPLLDSPKILRFGSTKSGSLSPDWEYRGYPGTLVVKNAKLKTNEPNAGLPFVVTQAA